MRDLTIEVLGVKIWTGAGHAHRVERIAARAAAIFAERLRERGEGGSWAADTSIDILRVPTLNIDFDRTGDEQAASQLVGALMQALAQRPER